MTVLSVDLAYKSYSDVGAVVLDQGQGRIHCELLPVSRTGPPSAETIADDLDEICRQRGIRSYYSTDLRGGRRRTTG